MIEEGGGLTAMRPEARNRLSDGAVLPSGVLVNIPRIPQLALSGAVDAMDLAMRQLLQQRHLQLLCERVDARMFQQLIARVIGVARGALQLLKHHLIRLQPRHKPRRVLARVQVL